MREYILTEEERRVIRDYLDKNIKPMRVRVLKHIMKKSLPELEADLDLVKKVLAKEG